MASSTVALDHNLLHDLSQYVEKLTTSGKQSLDPETMKKLKKICKLSDGYIKHAYHAIMTQLEKDHAEIRLSAFQIADELFNRSHAFRTLLLAEFQDFMDATIEANPDFPLPPPKSASTKLKTSAIDAIQKWNNKYGADYKKLSLGYNYLRACKKLDFNGAEVRTQAEQRRQEQHHERQELMRRQRLENVLKEISESSLEMKDVIIQSENCLKLLMPDPETFQIHGLMSPVHSPSYNNPFLSYASRTPAIAGKRAIRKTSDPSKIKNRSARRSVSSSSQSEESHRVIKQEPVNEPLDSDVVVDKLNRQTCNRPFSASSVAVDAQAVVSVKQEPISDLSAASSCLHTAHSVNNSDGLPGIVKTEAVEETLGSGVTLTTGRPDVSGSCGNDNSDDECDFEEISTPSSSEGEEDEEGEVEESDVVRDHGLVSQQYRMSIEVSPSSLAVQETEDNMDILTTLRDLSRQITFKLLPRVQRWLEVLSKTGADQSDVRKTIDIKNALLMAKRRIGSLRVRPMAKNPLTSKGKEECDGDDDDDEDDDGFEDVPEKEGYEQDIPQHLREAPKPPKSPTKRDWTLRERKPQVKEEELDPTTPLATLSKLAKEHLANKKESTEENQPGPSKEKIVSPSPIKNVNKDVPVVPFGTDLLHWGEEKVETPLVVKYESEHRFWNVAFENDDIVDKVALESIKTRTINFNGKFEPVKWTCRAPLPNGRLCPRRDRVKCPFHGKVIPRDNMGQPSNPEDVKRLIEEESKKAQDRPAEWEDSDLQAEIEAATGVSLNPSGSGTKGTRKGKKRKYPGLTNINKVEDSAKRRLERKLLNPRALKRVEEKATDLKNRRFQDKFGNNFNYAYTN